MNWLDILLMVIGGILVIIGIVFLVTEAMDNEIGIGLLSLISCLVFAFLIGFKPFIVIDKSSGITIGEITSVDKNYFGTTAIYLKVNEATEEEGCIENRKVVEQAKELVGKKVKVTYATRVGLYSTGKCNYAPIESIEEIK